MDLLEIETLANDLMHQHGLECYEIRLSNMFMAAGRCLYYSKTIKLSAPVLLMMPEHEIRDTILHEIAHALVGPGFGHSKYWKDTARRIGCTGKRCYDRSKMSHDNFGSK